MRLAILLLAVQPAFAQPGLLLDSRDFDRIRQLAASEPWAANVVSGLREYAEDWPAAHVHEFGLRGWDLPSR